VAATADVEQVSRALNITARRVQQLVKEGMPKAERGLYDLGHCMLWYIKHLQKALAARSSGEDGSMTSLMSERTKQARETSERMQMANLKARGEVLLAAEVKQEVSKAIAYLAQDLTALPQRITTDEAIQARAQDELILARDRFARNLESLAKPGGSVERRSRGHTRKAKTNPGRVGGRGKGAPSRNAGAGTVAK